MTVRILGRATSSNVQPVVWCAAELDLPFERIDVGGKFGGTDLPEFRAKNPNGLIPVLEDGALTLFESQAIIRYLAARYGSEDFWSKDPAGRARADMWMEWAKGSIATNVVYKVFWQLIRTKAADRDQATIDEAASALKSLMAIADAELEGQAFLAGDALTPADITFGAQLYRYFSLDFDRANLPHLQAYYDRLCERTAYQEHVMVSYESLRAE